VTEFRRARLNGSGHGKDPNDLRGHPDLIREAVEEAEEVTEEKQGKKERTESGDHFTKNAPKPPTRESLAIGSAEWTGSRLTPKCIVEDHLYADVAQRVAPGGTGKTTLTLWEAVHIVLGMPLYGKQIIASGWVLYITAEDPRERLVARLREICEAMELSEAQVAQVRRDLLFWDLTAEPARLAMEKDGNILLTPMAERIVEAFKDDPPVLTEFDPTVSFGASEARVNDNEQALVLAARVIVKGLDCAVRYTHHTGKGNARDKTTDQYSGRGGSAMADGCRMVHVLQSWEAKDKSGKRPPLTLEIGPQTGVITYTRAKMSHCPPNQPVIWIAREGFTYQWSEEHHMTPEQEAAANAEQVLQFLRSEIKAEHYYSKNTLEMQHKKLGMSRDGLREVLADLEVSNRLVSRDLPEELKQGGRQHYLSPSDVPPVNPAKSREVGEEDTHETF
jgi:RecA-family ATPase